MRGEALRWGRRWAAGVAVMGVLAAGVLALGGCTADADAEPGPSVSTSGSPTVSASPSQSPIVAPVRPAEMERSDEVGALAAAEYFMELHEFTYASGSTTEWSAASGQSCGFCTSVLQAVTSAYSAGGRIENGASSFTDFALVGHDIGLNVFGVSLSFDVEESRRIDAAGTVTGVIPAESGTLILELAPSARGWTIFGADVADGGTE